MKKIHADRDELGLPPSPKVMKTLKSIGPKVFSRYKDKPEIIDILAEKHGTQKERIFIEAGVIGAIHRTLDHILSPSSKILVPELGYLYYHKLAEGYGAQKLTFGFQEKEDRMAYDLDDLTEKMKQKPDILVLIDPESPFGFSIPEEDLLRILKTTGLETLVLLDQAHEGFRDEHIKDITGLVERFPNLVVFRGFSKFYGLAGVRIAYALCGDDIKERIKFRERYLGFDILAQKLAIAALQTEEHYRENARTIRQEKARFNKAIRKLRNYSVYETDTQGSVVKVPDEQSAFLAKLAKENGIHIRHLKDWHEKLENIYKISIGLPDDNDRIIDLFTSVAWVYTLDTYNSDAEPIIHTRDAGYTMHRKEIPQEKTGILMGLHRVILPPGKSVPAHSHTEQDELFEFHSDAIFELNGERLEVKEGDWMVVRPGDIHYLEAPKDRFARFIALRFPYSHEDKYSTSGKQIIHENS